MLTKHILLQSNTCQTRNLISSLYFGNTVEKANLALSFSMPLPYFFCLRHSSKLQWATVLAPKLARKKIFVALFILHLLYNNVYPYRLRFETVLNQTGAPGLRRR